VKDGPLAKEDSTAHKYYEAIWTDVTALRLRSHFSSAAFEVQRVYPPGPLAGQTPVIVDDGKASTTVLYGGQSLRASNLTATLTVGDKALGATGITVLENGQEIRVVFPSLKALGLAKDSEAPKQALRLSRRSGNTDTPLLGADGAACAYMQIPKPAPPAFQVQVGSSHILSQAARGSLRVSFTCEKGGQLDGLRIAAVGADIIAVEPAGSIAQGAGDHRWTLSTQGKSLDLLVGLQNLTAKSPVRIVATREKSGEVPASDASSPDVDVIEIQSRISDRP
jgi:hypothetical protein